MQLTAHPRPHFFDTLCLDLGDVDPTFRDELPQMEKAFPNIGEIDVLHGKAFEGSEDSVGDHIEDARLPKRSIRQRCQLLKPCCRKLLLAQSDCMLEQHI